MAEGTQEFGIKADATCLDTGSCERSIYKTLGIREDTQPEDNTFGFFVQDIFLSATFFIGTLVTFALVFSGFRLVTAGADENQASKGKDGIKWSILGLLMVVFSYSIIRIVQFLAQGQT